jgi:hypothetical protein
LTFWKLCSTFVPTFQPRLGGFGCDLKLTAHPQRSQKKKGRRLRVLDLYVSGRIFGVDANDKRTPNGFKTDSKRQKARRSAR